jgi:hypothetical protein
MKDFKKLLQKQLIYLNEKNPIYRKFYKDYFETLLKTDLIVIIQ